MGRLFPWEPVHEVTVSYGCCGVSFTLISPGLLFGSSLFRRWLRILVSSVPSLLLLGYQPRRIRNWYRPKGSCTSSFCLAAIQHVPLCPLYCSRFPLHCLLRDLTAQENRGEEREKTIYPETGVERGGKGGEIGCSRSGERQEERWRMPRGEGGGGGRGGWDCYLRA